MRRNGRQEFAEVVGRLGSNDRKVSVEEDGVACERALVNMDDKVKCTAYFVWMIRLVLPPPGTGRSAAGKKVVDTLMTWF